LAIAFLMESAVSAADVGQISGDESGFAALAAAK
jgi:hypothetical protein